MVKSPLSICRAAQLSLRCLGTGRLRRDARCALVLGYQPRMTSVPGIFAACVNVESPNPINEELNRSATAGQDRRIRALLEAGGRRD